MPEIPVESPDWPGAGSQRYLPSRNHQRSGPHRTRGGSLAFGTGKGKEGLGLWLPSPQVYITVLDENDNSPRFDFTSDSAVSVPEDCPVGQRVATVKARDPDAGSNGQVGAT